MDQGTIPAAALSNPDVDGIKVRWSWNQLEPREGSFNWSGLDGEVAQAHNAAKKISLGLVAGSRTPSWVYAAGAQSFPFIWDQPYGPGFCAVSKIPVPWNPIYLDKFEAFLSALAARYPSTFSYVNVAGINYTSEEIGLPHNRGRQPINNGQCSSNDDTSNWLSVGYTRTKIEQTWAVLESKFHSHMALRFGGQFVSNWFPPIDQNGNVIPNASSDLQCPIDLVNYGITNYPSNNLAQSNGLSPTRAGWPYIGQIASSTVTGYQMFGPWGNANELLQAGQRGIQAGGKYMEIYMSDVTNPNEASALAQLHSSMTNQ